MKNKGGGKGLKGLESSKKTVEAGERGQLDRVKGKNRYVLSFFTISFTH
jgi:hypothetical protein